MKSIRKNSDTVIIRNEMLEKYLRDIKKIKSLTQEEEYELLKLAKAGDIVARQKLVSANLRFVVTVAKEYQVKGFDICDLINAGNIGLIEAIDKFQLDNKVKVKFLSYAVWWIKNCIIEHIKEYGTSIRLPFNKQADLQAYGRLKEKLEQEYQVTLSADQVYELAGMELTDDLRSALKCSIQPSSLDSPLDSEDGTGDTLSETIAGEYTDPLAEDVKAYRLKAINSALAGLTETQQKVIRLSFGLDDQIFRSNEDIADALNLTAERVRQVRDISLDKLKKVHGGRLAQLL